MYCSYTSVIAVTFYAPCCDNKYNHLYRHVTIFGMVEEWGHNKNDTIMINNFKRLTFVWYPVNYNSGEIKSQLNFSSVKQCAVGKYPMFRNSKEEYEKKNVNAEIYHSPCERKLDYPDLFKV